MVRLNAIDHRRIYDRALRQAKRTEDPEELLSAFAQTYIKRKYGEDYRLEYKAYKDEVFNRFNIKPKEDQKSCITERTVQYNWGRMYESTTHKFTLVHNIKKNILTVYMDYDLKRYKRTISPYVNNDNELRWKIQEGGAGFYSPKSALNVACRNINADIVDYKKKVIDMKENGFTYLLDKIEKEQRG